MFKLSNNSKKAKQARSSNRQILSLFALLILGITIWVSSSFLNLDFFNPVQNYKMISDQLNLGMNSFPKGSNGYDRLLMILVETVLIGLIIAPLIVAISCITIILRNLYYLALHHVEPSELEPKQTQSRNNHKMEQ